MTAPIVVIGATGVVGQGVCEAVIAAGRPVIAVGRSRACSRRCASATAGFSPPCRPTSPTTRTDGASASAWVNSPSARWVQSPRSAGAASRPACSTIAWTACAGGSPRTSCPTSWPRAMYCRTCRRTASTSCSANPGPSRRGQALAGNRSRRRCLRMLARALHEEARTRDRLVQLLAIDTPVEVRDCERRAWCWPTPFEVGATTLSLIESTNPNTPPRRALQPRASTLRVRKVGRPGRARGPR